MSDTLDLHDGVLLDLNFNWAKRDLRCTVRAVSSHKKQVIIYFSDVKRMNIPLDHPWGKSSSINDLKKVSSEEGAVFNLEMQSGDVIEIVASDIRIE